MPGFFLRKISIVNTCFHLAIKQLLLQLGLWKAMSFYYAQSIAAPFGAVMFDHMEIFFLSNYFRFAAGLDFLFNNGFKKIPV